MAGGRERGQLDFSLDSSFPRRPSMCNEAFHHIPKAERRIISLESSATHPRRTQLGQPSFYLPSRKGPPPLFNFRPTDRSLKPTVLTGLHARSLAQKNSLVFSARSLAARRPVRPTRDASAGRGGAEGDRRRDAPLAVPSATVARGSLPRQTDGRMKGEEKAIARPSFSARTEIKGQSVFVVEGKKE